MKNLILIPVFSLLFLSCGKKADNTQAIKKEKGISLYTNNFNIKTISGNTFDLKSLKGKKVMIVNTASKCGLTPQYEKLEALYQKYKNKNFIIIGFPANDFLSQEPGTNQEIAHFCKQNYGVSFPMMEKISVKGNTMHPLYQFLTEKNKNGFSDSEVAWNFQKYLIDEEGHIQHIIAPKTTPDAQEIVNWITQ